MCDSSSDFSGVKVGDKLWSVQLGECEVLYISTGEWPIVCQNERGTGAYTANGKKMEDDVNPSLFWSRPKIIAPPKPKRKVVKTVERWLNVHKDGRTFTFSSERDANQRSDFERIACVRLTGTYEVEE